MDNIQEKIVSIDNTFDTRKKMMDIVYKWDCILADLDMDCEIDRYFIRKDFERKTRLKICDLPRSEKKQRLMVIKNKKMLGFRFRMVYINGKLSFRNSGGVDGAYFRLWLRQAKKNIIWWWKARQGRGVINVSNKKEWIHEIRKIEKTALLQYKTWNIHALD